MLFNAVSQAIQAEIQHPHIQLTVESVRVVSQSYEFVVKYYCVSEVSFSENINTAKLIHFGPLWKALLFVVTVLYEKNYTTSRIHKTLSYS